MGKVYYSRSKKTRFRAPSPNSSLDVWERHIAACFESEDFSGNSVEEVSYPTATVNHMQGYYEHDVEASGFEDDVHMGMLAEEVVDRLDDRQRVVIDRLIEGRSIREIAEELGVTTSMVNLMSTQITDKCLFCMPDLAYEAESRSKNVGRGEGHPNRGTYQRTRQTVEQEQEASS